jgi:hypothetical protein
MDSQTHVTESPRRKCSFGSLHVAIILICVALFAGCASKPAKPAAPKKTETTSQEEGPEVLPPSGAKPQELPADAPPAAAPPAPEAPPAPPPPPALPKAFGVWIDGAGLDSIEALGVLQELEAKGLKPAKVVGTGFGCWIALSWALENRGNRAEWQTFKWSDWSHVSRSGLLARLGLGRARSAFQGEVKRLLAAQRFENLALPADCPVVRKGGDAHLVSGREWDLTTILWHQFQIPALEADLSKTEVWSGLIAGTPTPQELDEFAADIPADKVDFRGWLIIKTRSSADRAGPDDWSGVLADRGDRRAVSTGPTPAGKFWTVLDLAGDRQGADIRDFDRRREWLLKGRRAGSKIPAELSSGSSLF